MKVVQIYCLTFNAHSIPIMRLKFDTKSIKLLKQNVQFSNSQWAELKST